MASKPDISSWYDLLPAQVLGQIVTHLCPADVARFRAVCRAWHSAARQHGRHEHQPMPNGSFCTIGDDSGALLNPIPSLISPTSSPSSSSWSDLLPDLLGRAIAHLPFPTDRARFRAVCRAWHSAAHQHMRQLPWLVFPDGSFCTVGADGVFFTRIPGFLPDNVTCLGAAADGWLALDRTDNVFRRTNPWDTYIYGKDFLQPRADIKHRHTYLLHNPFSSRTVALPELDSIIGDVAETFEVRKVLMRSSPSAASSPYDDLVAVTTNNWNCNVILCRPGKGSCVLNHMVRVIDVAFHGDKLYGITSEEDLVAFDLAEDDKGRPNVTRCWRVIKDDSDDDDDDAIGGDEVEEEAPEQEAPDSSCLDDGDGMVPDGEVTEAVYEPIKGYDTTTRRLVQSSSGESLLMVRHHTRIPSSPYESYTRGVDIFKADMEAGKWVPVNALPQGDALFLSRSFSKSTRAYYGDIKEGSLYFADMDDVFDTKCWTRRPLSRPRQWTLAYGKLLTWLFPPQLLV